MKACLTLVFALSLTPGGIAQSIRNEYFSTSSDEVVPLDSSSKGAGKFCPRTLSQYFSEIDHLFNSAEQDFSQVSTTTGGSGRVLSGKIDPLAKLTTYFQSDFTNLNNEQVTYITSLYTENKFSEELDSTYKPGTQKTLRSTTEELGVESELYRTEFIFLAGFPPMDRELMLVNGIQAINETCVVYANPSVSDRWIKKALRDSSTYWSAAWGSLLVRAQNLYPSGDRVCVRPKGGGYDVQVIHMITTSIGGLLSPLYSLGLFDAQTQAAYLSEAQKLEEKVHQRV